MDKKIEVKKKEAGIQLQDLLTRLPKGIDVTESARGTILRIGKTYLMHVAQTSRGLHHFVRTKTGKHLESAYAVTEKDVNSIVKEIEDKIKNQKIDDKIKNKPSTKIKNEWVNKDGYRVVKLPSRLCFFF